jgi:hypothetical protein
MAHSDYYDCPYCGDYIYNNDHLYGCPVEKERRKVKEAQLSLDLNDKRTNE